MLENSTIATVRDSGFAERDEWKGSGKEVGRIARSTSLSARLASPWTVTKHSDNGDNMQDPFQPPENHFKPSHPTDTIRPPAIALIVVSGIALGLGTLGLIGDVFLLASGAIGELDRADPSPISNQTIIMIRVAWGIMLLLASSFVLFGAIQMLKRKNYSLSKNASIVAMIPLVGPCCLLGIPFGIWAFVALNKPGVKESFG